MAQDTAGQEEAKTDGNNIWERGVTIGWLLQAGSRGAWQRGLIQAGANIKEGLQAEALSSSNPQNQADGILLGNWPFRTRSHSDWGSRTQSLVPRQ